MIVEKVTYSICLYFLYFLVFCFGVLKFCLNIHSYYNTDYCYVPGSAPVLSQPVEYSPPAASAPDSYSQVDLSSPLDSSYSVYGSDVSSPGWSWGYFSPPSSTYSDSSAASPPELSSPGNFYSSYQSSGFEPAESPGLSSPPDSPYYSGYQSPAAGVVASTGEYFFEYDAAPILPVANDVQYGTADNGGGHRAQQPFEPNSSGPARLPSVIGPQPVGNSGQVASGTVAHEDGHFVPPSNSFSGQNFISNFDHEEAVDGSLGWNQFGPPVVVSTTSPTLHFSVAAQQGKDVIHNPLPPPPH